LNDTVFTSEITTRQKHLFGITLLSNSKNLGHYFYTGNKANVPAFSIMPALFPEKKNHEGHIKAFG